MTEEKKEVLEETKSQVQEDSSPDTEEKTVSEENSKPSSEEKSQTEATNATEDVPAPESKPAAEEDSDTNEEKLPEPADKVEKPKSEKTEPEKQDMEEDVIRLEDLAEETEYSQKEIDFLTQMYDKTLKQIKQGDIVKGKILDVTDSDVLVDIGFKSEGIIPGDEFDNLKEVNVGDELEVFLENVEDPNGQLILSRKRADFIRVWENVVEKHEKNETISGMIVRRIKGGMVVTLNGVDAFLPGSQIDVKPIRDFDSYLGREMDFKIVKVNHARRNIVVSSRVLIEK
jgi:small subunit ribosomal protein S1